MTPKRKPSSSHRRGQRPFDSNEPKGKPKAQFDSDPFNSQSMYERYKCYFFNRTILSCRDIYFV